LVREFGLKLLKRVFAASYGNDVVMLVEEIMGCCKANSFRLLGVARHNFVWIYKYLCLHP
jgi:hypothetical protein